MTQLCPSQRREKREENRTLALVTAALFSCLSEAQVKRQPFFLFMPPSLSSLFLSPPLSSLRNRSSIVAASERLLWHLSERRRRRTRGGGGETKHTPNKEIEQEKGKKGCVWRPLFFFLLFLHRVHPPLHTPTHPHPFLPPAPSG